MRGHTYNSCVVGGDDNIAASCVDTTVFPELPGNGPLKWSTIS